MLDLFHSLCENKIQAVLWTKTAFLATEVYELRCTQSCHLFRYFYIHVYCVTNFTRFDVQLRVQWAKILTMTRWQGIGPVDDEELLRADAAGGEDAAEEGEREGEVYCQWREALGGTLNALAASGALLAAGGSDGRVRVWRREEGRLRPLHTLDGHEYPVMAVDFGAEGALLLSAGLDGGARLWDVQVGGRRRKGRTVARRG